MFLSLFVKLCCIFVRKLSNSPALILAPCHCEPLDETIPRTGERSNYFALTSHGIFRSLTLPSE
jgi:hypothetical protein